ncbi:VOC family protein [Pleurocapsales cyanobacterium LEGE 06147]|nr:VOC family protein [Pleurocapsales cyanobacterium LEGE 06147]
MLLNHVGVTVTEIDKAIKWYGEVLGFELLMGPLEIDVDNPTIGEICSDIFGENWQSMRQAHMSMSNGIGLEIFEFVEPKAERRENNFEYWKNGFFHICVTNPDVKSLANKIAETGGKQRSKVWTVFPGCDVVYCEDPFGNIVEIYSRSYEQFYANRADT